MAERQAHRLLLFCSLYKKNCGRVLNCPLTEGKKQETYFKKASFKKSGRNLNKNIQKISNCNMSN